MQPDRGGYLSGRQSLADDGSQDLLLQMELARESARGQSSPLEDMGRSEEEIDAYLRT